jgi:hypothetical protein
MEVQERTYNIVISHKDVSFNHSHIYVKMVLVDKTQLFAKTIL